MTIEATTEPWLDKKGIARHFACSVRSTGAMPYTTIMGRKKFKASESEAWLEANGKLERHGETVDTASTTKWPGSV